MKTTLIVVSVLTSIAHGEDAVVLRGSQRRLWQVGSKFTDAVHEEMTFLGLKQALLASDADWIDGFCPSEGISEYVRGSVWNDDPSGLLFDDTGETVFGWYGHCHDKFDRATGSTFAWRLKSSECENLQSNFPTSLLCSSHHGSLAFLHSMAEPGQLPSDTKSLILKWADFTYKVAVGDIDETSTVLSVLPQALSKRFQEAKVPATLTVKNLFAMRDSDGSVDTATWIETSKRALGSLAHMVEDSFAAGHVGRKSGTGPVLQFRDYPSQEPGLFSLHAAHDEKPPASSSFYPAYLQAAKHVGDLFTRYKTKESWVTVEPWLNNIVFTLDDNVVPAGSGQVVYTIKFVTWNCWWYYGCQTRNNVELTICFHDNQCTPPHSFGSFPRGVGYFDHLTTDFGIIEKIKIRKIGWDAWYPESVTVGYTSQIFGKQEKSFWIAQWISNNDYEFS